MFGSKLRSWMENHIVRSRKKGNKHKNGTNNGANSLGNSTHKDAAAATLNNKKSATLHSHHANGNLKVTMPTSPVLASSGSHVVHASPARRREVSPIQCHTPSRYGWQSPDQDTITLPKSDSLSYALPCYRQHQQPQQQQQQHQQQQQQEGAQQQEHLSVQTTTNSKNSSSTDKSPVQVNCSSSSISSLSWSTGSKEPSMQSSSKRDQLKTDMEGGSLIPLSSNYDYSLKAHEYSEVVEIEMDDEDAVHYEEVGTLLRRDVETFAGNSPQNSGKNFVDYQRPNSEHMNSFRCEYGNNSMNECDKGVRYGRILPSRLPAIASDSVESLHVRSELPAVAAANSANVRLRIQRSGNFMVSRATMGLAAVPPHSLSSPESAYSTGYSTDGTSPGAANYNPPEYYINMRTGTHYFPKSINSLAIEAQRYKFGLNRIEEMSPMDPLPKTSFGQKTSNDLYGQQQPHLECHSPPTLHSASQEHANNVFESSSPRQRCRIRTNPWYSNSSDASGQHLTPIVTTTTPSAFACVNSVSSSAMRMEIDSSSITSTTSSGVKSCNEQEAAKERNRQNVKLAATVASENAYESSESTSSLTEVENAMYVRTFSPHIVKYKHLEQHLCSPLLRTDEGAGFAVGKGKQRILECQDTLMSDDEATLNEMIGKFDESYIYEKETDILSSSDSELTDCPSELETGQDAGDECDTDELLDIDFIDTSSMQEVLDRKDVQQNLGSCCYYSNSSPTRFSRQNVERKSSIRSRRTSRSLRASEVPPGNANASGHGASQRRRKRYMKTRKKSVGNREKLPASPLPRRTRESISLGGTPVCLRRNHLSVKECIYKTSPISNRSNSLVFTANNNGKQVITIAESEKALLRADLEADIKYRQLIMEAESLLESMKNSLQSIPRDTPVASPSPRRLNPLANKRVEMLRNSEVVESKKQMLRSSTSDKDLIEHELAAAINKRIEILKLETASAPNSPRLSGRCSPRKTHLTNFINQNAATEVPQRNKVSVSGELYKTPQSPQLQLNGRYLQSPAVSPQTPRRANSPNRSAAWHNANLQLSDSEQECAAMDLVNHNFLQQLQSITETMYDRQTDYNNRNVSAVQSHAYCPHSEPLKRKVYKGSSTFERIKKTFDLELEMPKQTTPTGFPYERQRSKNLSNDDRSSINDMTSMYSMQEAIQPHASNKKQQLILNTIADLKHSLEHQSYELSGLNGE